MSRRFEGAITTAPEDEPQDSSLPPPAERPDRPVIIEIAAAILIVGGITAILGTAGATLSAGSAPRTTPILALELGLDVLMVAIGLLVRAGRAWLVCINVVAVLVFLEFTAVPSGSAIAITLAVVDSIAFIGIARHRAWFDWRPDAGETTR
jgi:lysylphosphatidylglycerol synthetase-like protein (DUF2156 family)